LMMQFLIAHFGLQFARQIMIAPTPVALPIVTYGDTWACTIYVLY
jgi:hypothetical protein